MLKHLLAALIVLIAPAAAFAQPLIDRIPADSCIYIGWQGASSMPPAYADSHLKAVVDMSNFGPLIGDFLPRLIQQASKNDPQAMLIMQSVKSIGGPLWRHPSALFQLRADFSAPASPRPKGALICQAGDEADALLVQLKALAALAAGAPFPVKAFKSGDLVVLSAGFDKEADVLAGPSFATNARFKQALAHVQSDAVFIAYADVESIIANVDEGAAKMAPPNDAATWAKVRDALGLKGIQRLILTAGFEARDWSTRIFIAAPAPRTGIASLLESKPISDETLKLIPARAMSATIGRLNPAELFDLVRNVAGQIEPKSQAAFDLGVAQANQFLGFDLRGDLLAAFGDEWVMYTAPASPADPAGLVLMNSLAKPAEAERTLNRLEELGKALLARNPNQPGFALGQNKADNLTIHTITTPQGLSLYWTIGNGSFYLAVTQQTLADAARSVPVKGILDNPDFIAARKRLAGASPLSASYTDIRKTAELMYPGILQAVQFGMGLAQQAGIEPPANLLPTFDRLVQHLGIAACFTWTDAAGWHFRGSSPFPLSTTLSPSGSALTTIGASAMVISITLPALNAARERANRVKCASNLRQIGQAALLFANDGGNYPPDMGLMVTKCDLSPEVFVCPSGSNSLPQAVRNARIEEQAKWVVQHADYIYLGANMKPNGPADAIIACEKPENHDRDGFNILFNDGHVDWFRFDEGMKLIEKQQRK